jgi:hypothetical protein
MSEQVEKKDIAAILDSLKANYKSMRINQEVVDTWYESFKTYKRESLEAAKKLYIESETFAPNVATFKLKLNRLVAPAQRHDESFGLS